MTREYQEDAANVQALKDEMVGLFNQKRSLGLMNCGKDLGAFSDEPPKEPKDTHPSHPRSAPMKTTSSA
jgi:hypothetical protein